MTIKIAASLSPALLPGAPLLYGGDLLKGIGRVADLGYDGMELHLRDPGSADLGTMLGAAEQAGLAVVAIGTGQAFTVDGLTISSPDAAVRSRAVERLMGHIALAERTKALVIVGSMQGRLAADDLTRRKQYTAAVAALRCAADRAATAGVTIVIEALNRYETNFVNTVDEALALVEDVDSGNVKVLLDTFHMNIEEPSLPEAIVRAGALLGHVHLVDSNRRAPGMGHTDLGAVVRALRSIGYRGYVAAEVLPLPDSETAARANIEHVKTLLNS